VVDGGPFSSRPRIASAAAFVCLLLCTVTLVARQGQRELGLRLEGDAASASVRIVEGRGDARAVPSGAVLLSVAAGDRSLDIEARDLTEDPDAFDTYPEMAEFFDRQRLLASMLREPEVTLTVREHDAATRTLQLRPARPRVAELPRAFWFQLVAAAVAFLLSAWPLILRPRELGVKLFAFLGATIPIFILPAALYGTRELAVDGALFRVLSSVNHLGANLFGLGLVALFLSYPVRLVGSRWLAVVAAAVLGWFIVDMARLAPDQNWGSRLPIFLELGSAVVLGLVQWRATRGDPRGRAGLRWMGASVLIGSGAFVLSIVGSSALALFPPISQGYAFGFFLLMHAGFAIGLARHRLFDLDTWSYVALFWLLASAAVVTTDLAIVTLFNTSTALSTGVVFALTGFLYLPLRALLWSRVASHRVVPQHVIFEAILEVTFAKPGHERTARWRGLLGTLFDPAEMVPVEEKIDRGAVEDEGLRLVVPTVGDIPAFRLGYPWKCRGLFSARHARIVDNIAALVRHAESRREAYERGAQEERTRIARDMHDDVAAVLLSALHAEDLASSRETVRRALEEVRGVVDELAGRAVPLCELAADIRHETVRRLEAAAIVVEWPIPSFDPGISVPGAVARHVTSIFRELTSNVIKHSQARSVTVRFERRPDGRLAVTFVDDGVGFDPASPRGDGLENLAHRAKLLGSADIVFERGDGGGTSVRFEIDLARGAGAPDAITSPSHAETPPQSARPSSRPRAWRRSP
jgi:signal transduction histidine kinase